MSSDHFVRQQRYKKAIIILLSLATIATLLGCSSMHERAHAKDAAKAYKSQKFAEAAKDFSEALKINPDREVNWKYLGYCYWSLIEPGSTTPQDREYSNKALEAFQRYLNLHGRDDKIQDFIINIYINQNMLDEGIQYYLGQLKLYPDDPHIMTTLSTMYAKKDDFDNSLRYALMKAELQPDDIAVWQFIGELCWNRSYQDVDYDDKRDHIVDQGIDALNKALSIDKNNFNAHLFMNLLYKEKSKIATNRAKDARSRRKKRELLIQANDWLKKANEERDTAIAIKNGGNNSESPAQPGGEASPTPVPVNPGELTPPPIAVRFFSKAPPPPFPRRAVCIGGFVGSVEGGVAGGALGGVLGTGKRGPVKKKVMAIGTTRPVKVIHQVYPVYPPAAQAMGLAGRVIVQVIINEHGRVVRARILRSSNPIFNQAALTAAKKWKFSPPLSQTGRKVSVYYIIPFKLRPGL